MRARSSESDSRKYETCSFRKYFGNFFPKSSLRCSLANVSFSVLLTMREKSGRFMIPSRCGISSGFICFATTSPTNNSLASLWFTMLCICSGINSWSTGTATAPYVMVARKATAQWLMFLPQIAILSPGFTPLFSKRMCIFSIFLATSLYCRVAP